MREVKKKRLSKSQVRAFHSDIFKFYAKQGRTFAWRKTTDPYRILVSEVMLQQTQTMRVREKYDQFIKSFPTIRALATAPLRQVLRVWQGLGYNRRAMYLRDLARTVVREHRGKLPGTVDELMQLPGVGAYTAAAVTAFAFNQPVVMIETNIRAVFIERFFRRASRKISDAQILPLIEQTIYQPDVRKWYYALMDYGAHLKNVKRGIGRRSAHHKTQSRFVGSNRQLRGMIMRIVLREKLSSFQKLSDALPRIQAKKVRVAVDGLVRDGLLKVGAKESIQLVA